MSLLELLVDVDDFCKVLVRAWQKRTGLGQNEQYCGDKMSIVLN